MERIIRKLKRIRLVFRQSTPLTKAAVCSAVVLALVALLGLNIAIGAAADSTASMADEAARLEQENKELQENIDSLGSADSVGKIAEDELGLVDPDTVVIDPNN